jgi:protein-tyrosine kinase
MENIRQAVERARSRSQERSGTQPRQARYFGDTPEAVERRSPEVELDADHLRSQRIVAFDGKDPHSRSFDMLRTEVLRSMDLMGWKTLAVTSPTPNCGKTLTAINLALSIARQPERQVLLADLDLRRPRLASYTGLTCEGGTVAVIEGKVGLENAVARGRVGDSQLEFLPTLPAANYSDLVSSRAMKLFLEDITRPAHSQIVVLDLPPLLAGHDVISILPQVDCVLLVTAVGTTTVAEIQEANKYLADASIVRVVLNKVTQTSNPYVFY